MKRQIARVVLCISMVLQCFITPVNALGFNETIEMSSTQRNSINMLNYLTVLAQQVDESKGDQLFLETAYSSLVNDLNPNAVDTKTQGQISSMMDTIKAYRMISVKRERLEFIYEKARSQAFRQAIPNPVGLLSAVQSGSLIKGIASVLYMTVDSVTSYKSATSQADLSYIQDGWELDDAEEEALHSSTKNEMNYMFTMVRDYDLPGNYALNKEAVSDFVSWTNKPDSQIVAKISWLEAHEETYQEFGQYWLECAKDYYNSNDYRKCLAAIKRYESLDMNIFRKNREYATVLPMAIVSAKETMTNKKYVETADKYCDVILDNIKDSDWSLRYFAAQIYLDLYKQTSDDKYLDKVYNCVYNNIVILSDEQRNLNTVYLADVKEVKASKDATKREKSEIKKYNKNLKEERKIALPPVSEALYLNCDLLFSLADKRTMTKKEKYNVDAVLHPDNDAIFLTKTLDDRFWFNSKADSETEVSDITFDGEELVVPVTMITDRSIISVTVKGDNGVAFDDWSVDKVDRPKKANYTDITAAFQSDKAEKYKYHNGDVVTIKIIPVSESPDTYYEYQYNVKVTKKAKLFDITTFERVS